jgi:hypothetical protein
LSSAKSFGAARLLILRVQRINHGGPTSYIDSARAPAPLVRALRTHYEPRDDDGAHTNTIHAFMCMLYTPAGGQYIATESGAGASLFIFIVEQSLFDYPGQSFSSQIYILSLLW